MKLVVHTIESIHCRYAIVSESHPHEASRKLGVLVGSWGPSRSRVFPCVPFQPTLRARRLDRDGDSEN